MVVAVIAAVALAVGLVLWGLSQPLGQEDGSSSVSSAVTVTTQKTLPKSFIDRNTAATSIVLANITDGQVLYRKNADAKCYPASMTKLLTALVVLENATPETPITVGREVNMISAGSSRAYLTVGTRMTVEQLLYAMLLPSGNDAAYVLAVQVGRLIANDQNLEQRAAVNLFVEKMNKKATELGCTASHFANPDGYHDDNHYTTPDDMLKIATAALQNHIIATVTATKSLHTTLLSGQSVSWENTNRLRHDDDSFYYEGAVGLKTGFTDPAGYCLAAAATREGRTAVAIIMRADSATSRFEDARGLLDLCFQYK